MAHVSARGLAAAEEFATVGRFFEGVQARTAGGGDFCDFTFGNPHEMPLPGLVAALRKSVEPEREDWFAYKASEAEPRAVIADALSRELGLGFEPEDVTLTQGAFGAIALAFRLVMDKGAEVVIPVPGWFCYAPMLRAADLVPVRAALDPERFDLDLAAIEAAISPRTRMVVVNSPHNPTGRIYPRADLEALAALLEAASARIGARIWLLSDEPYRRIRFDGNGFVSPAAVYPWTLIDYSYGKVLLAPGQRLGYLALSPLMPAAERQALRAACFPCQMALGWTYPDAVMQHAVPALEEVSIDIAALSRAAGPDARGAGAVGLPADPAGRDLLPLGRGARRRRGALRRRAGGAGGAGHAGDALRAAGGLPHLADGERGDDRAGAAGVSGGGLKRAEAGEGVLGAVGGDEDVVVVEGGDDVGADPDRGQRRGDRRGQADGLEARVDAEGDPAEGRPARLADAAGLVGMDDHRHPLLLAEGHQRARRRRAGLLTLTKTHGSGSRRGDEVGDEAGEVALGRGHAARPKMRLPWSAR